MTLEKIILRNNIIAQHLSEIALHGDRIEPDGSMQPVGPQFRAVLSAQERLLNAVEQLLEKLHERNLV